MGCVESKEGQHNSAMKNIYWYSWSERKHKNSISEVELRKNFNSNIDFSVSHFNSYNCFCLVQQLANYQIYHSHDICQCCHKSTCQQNLSLPISLSDRCEKGHGPSIQFFKIQYFMKMVYCKKDLISKGLHSTLRCIVKMWILLQMVSTVKEIDLVLNILILVLILNIFPNFHPDSQNFLKFSPWYLPGTEKGMLVLALKN
jgi:hypothetical protein